MQNIDPVAFRLFGFSVNWYGIIIAAATLLAIFLVMREAKRKGIKEDDVIDLALLCIPLAIVGARLYYVAFEWDMFAGGYDSFSWQAVGGVLWNIVDIRSGGLAIYGSVIGGLIAVFIFSKWKKIGFLRIVDMAAPALILAQALGRWGNFFNQEAYGQIISNLRWQFFPVAVYISATGHWHMATFFYESIWCFLSFILLYIYQRHSKKDGNVFALYLVLYGFERMIVEGFRLDSLYVGDVRVSQILSAVVFVAAGIYLLAQYVRASKGLKEKLAAAHAAQEDPALKVVQEDAESAETSGTEPAQSLWAESSEDAYVYNEEEIKAQAAQATGGKPDEKAESGQAGEEPEEAGNKPDERDEEEKKS